MDTVRSMKEDNERLMRAQAEQSELNAMLLLSLSKYSKTSIERPK
jgi:hypothetical protein